MIGIPLECLLHNIIIQYTHIQDGFREVSSLKHTASEVTVGQIGASESGTLEIDIPQVKV